MQSSVKLKNSFGFNKKMYNSIEERFYTENPAELGFESDCETIWF